MVPLTNKMTRIFLALLIPSFASPTSIPTDNTKDVAVRSARDYPPTLSFASGPVLTSKWFEGTNEVQVLEMILKNTHLVNSLTLADGLNVTISSDSLYLVTPGTLTRLAPGQSAVVQIGVKNNANVASGTICSATVTASWGAPYNDPHSVSSAISGPCGIPTYTADATSLSFHWNPDWFNEVKFGIFIHWGIYAAPAYGSVAPNEDYAEWYWKRLYDSNHKTRTYQYHNQTYGANFNYDDFISNFTAANFDANTWVDLIANSGAQYMVPVTKHHDGFALFNFSTAIGTRSSVHLGPKRDFISELLTAAKTRHPAIRRGTYFSLPEWFNPAYKPYAAGDFPGGPPINTYTGAEIPYTGYVPVNDFVKDIQLPQQNVLAYEYETEIMWCDIGLANNATIFASQWLNWARSQGRQVTFNSRCGLPGDFDTPEYTTNAGTVVRKWETNRGMDPFSFGYNYQTPDNQYLTGQDIVGTLVDVVSKNGNFLLDIGPAHDGAIPSIMSSGLLDAGSWIKAHSESIFNTRYWSQTPGADPFRYTTTQDAFYIHINSKPNSNTVLIPDPIPYLPGDTVTVLGGNMNGVTVPITSNSNGTYTLQVSNEILAADKYVYTFKLAYTSDW